MESRPGKFSFPGLRLIAACLVVMIAGLGLSGCDKDDDNGTTQSPPYASEFDGDAVGKWLQLSYEAVRDASYSPPVASRAFGYCGVAAYEAVRGGIPYGVSLAGQLNELPGLPDVDHALDYHWGQCANSAIADVMREMFAGKPEQLARIDSLEAAVEAEYAAEVDASVFDRSDAYGEAIAEAVINWSREDGYSELHGCSWDPPEGDGLWIPTPPAYAGALEPCWGQVRPFVMTDVSLECDPGPPPAFSENPSSEFYGEMFEVYTVSTSLTDDERDIAYFWADNPGQTGTPPGHWVSILGMLVVQEDYQLHTACEAYARIGVAMADAFISCWWSKFEYDLIRPVSCIRAMIDPEWSSIVVTPPFPEYTSGHSVQSGAASQVLKDFLGDMPFTDDTHANLGLAPRSFDSFAEAAEEAAISRLYGGIHYRAAIERGVAQGRCIGQMVSNLTFRATS